MTKNTSKTRHFCKYCKKTVIGTTYKFNSHLFMHNAIKARHKCKYCSKEYYRFDIYKRHLNKHMGVNKNKKTYICDYCDRSFANKISLIPHLKNVHDECINPKYVKYFCKACDIAYCEKRILDNHIRKCHFNIELKEEPSHFKKLLNEKWIEPTIDNTCVEMTKINNNVITIQKCGKIESVAIKKEVKKHALYRPTTDQYSIAICDYCNKEMLKKSLRNHIREMHLKIKKFSCSKCKKKYARHYQLVGHYCGKGRLRRKRCKKEPPASDSNRDLSLKTAS